MKLSDFDIGKTYKAKQIDWITPDDEVIKGKEYLVTVLEPANKNNSLWDDEVPPDSVIYDWQTFLRVQCVVSKKVFLLHPNNIKSAELVINNKIYSFVE